MCAFAAYSALAWLPTYFQRAFDWTPARAGILLGPMFGVLGLTGIWAGGLCGDYLYRRRADGHTRTVQLSLLAIAVLFPAFLAAPSDTVALAVLTIPAGLLGMFQGPLAAAVQNVCRPEQRGIASGIYLFAINLIGQSLGPSAVGIVSSLVGGLRPALLLIPLSALAGAYFLQRAGDLTLAAPRGTSMARPEATDSQASLPMDIPGKD